PGLDLSDLRTSLELGETKDHKLRRLHHGKTDDANQPAIVDVSLRHGCAIHLDEECFRRLEAHQCATAPLGDQKLSYRLIHPRPEFLVVGLKHDKLSSFID